jgi:hypothetical protein
LSSHILQDTTLRVKAASETQVTKSTVTFGPETVSGVESDRVDDTAAEHPPGQFHLVKIRCHHRRRLEAEHLAPDSPLKLADAERMALGRLASPGH